MEMLYLFIILFFSVIIYLLGCIVYFVVNTYDTHTELRGLFEIVVLVSLPIAVCYIVLIGLN
jgi:hypothetical protein